MKKYIANWLRRLAFRLDPPDFRQMVRDAAASPRMAAILADIAREEAAKPIPTATDRALAEWNSPEQQQIRAEAIAEHGVPEIKP